MTRINYQSTSATSSTILDLEGLQLKATCTAGNLDLKANTTTANAFFTANANELTSANEVDTIRQAWATGDAPSIIGTGDYHGDLSYKVVTGTGFLSRTHIVEAQFSAIDEGTTCRVFGHATSTNSGINLILLKKQQAAARAKAKK